MTKEQEQKTLKLEYVVVIILSGILIVATSACSNKAAAEAQELAHLTEKLRSEMNANIQKGLSGLGIQDGVPLLGNNANIQRCWGAALQQARQMSGLISKIRRLEPAYKTDDDPDFLALRLQTGIETRARLETTFANRAVLNEHDAQVAGAFLAAANSVANQIGQPLPFPQSQSR